MKLQGKTVQSLGSYKNRNLCVPRQEKNNKYHIMVGTCLGHNRLLQRTRPMHFPSSGLVPSLVWLVLVSRGNSVKLPVIGADVTLIKIR